MADPKTKSGDAQDSSEYFIECDDRRGSLYKTLFKESSFSPLARQGRMVLKIKILPKPSSRSAKKTAGS